MREIAVRCIDQTVQTATWEMTHPSGRTATLIGMMHIGEPEYYQKISADLAHIDSRGGKIQYEQVKKRPDDALEALPEAEQEQVRELREAMKGRGSSVLAEALGLSFQKTLLTYPPGAENVDVDDVHLMQQLGYETMRKMFVHKKLGEDEDTARILRKVLRFTMRHYRVLSTVVGLIPGGRSRKRVILDERNDVAIEGIRPHLTERDVALVWGAAHLPGLRRALEREGYKVTRRTWKTACTL